MANPLEFLSRLLHSPLSDFLAQRWPAHIDGGDRTISLANMANMAMAKNGVN